MITDAYLATLLPDQRLKIKTKEFLKIQNDPIYFIENYLTVTDPTLGERVPFELYTYQNKAVKDFEVYDYTLTMKTRQTGLTTISEAYTAWWMVTKENQIIVALAYEMKSSKKFLKGVRDFIDDARSRCSWLIPDYLVGNNGKESFTLQRTNCQITAEANKPDAGRGATINLACIDEISAITWMEEIWASMGLTLTRSRGKCIGVSTPKGSSGWYFDRYTNAEEEGWHIIEAHWSEHPIYRQGMYQWIKDESKLDGGYIKMLNNEWPDLSFKQNVVKYKPKKDYVFIKDGKIRSPWYDVESKKLGVQKTKCELDCSFAGSGGEVIDADVVRSLTSISQLNPPINQTQRGPMKSYKIYREFDSDHQYIIVCDVATGDGNDYSTITILDLTTKELVATFKDQPEPIFFAQIIWKVARDWGKPLVIVEYQGPGLTVLMELQNKYKYANLYYTNLKTKEITRGQKRKLGFWQSASTKSLGGDVLESVINSGEWKFYSIDFINELHTWVWTKEGKRDHLEGKNDDVCMALTMGMYYIYHVFKRRETNSTMMKTHFSFDRIQTGTGMGQGDQFSELFGSYED